MDYIAQSKDYWVAPNAIYITLNAMGDANRVQASVASGAAIMCYLKNNAGDVLLDYDSAHQFQTWPLSLSPTYFNTDTQKYIYCAIPRTAEVGTTAVIVFPSEMLDVYGINANGTQVGSEDYYYIFLQGVIGAVESDDGVWKRRFVHLIDTGSKGTDEALEDKTESDWYLFSKVSQIVTFLKPIVMDPASWFQNLRLGNSQSNLTGVATALTPDDYVDADYLVATPSYVNAHALSKKHDDVAEGNITFEKDIHVKGNSAVDGHHSVGGNASVEGKLGVKGLLSALAGIFTNRIQSDNFTGDSMADTGFLLTNNHQGRSRLVIDEIYVRMKAVFESVEVKKKTYTGGDQIWSCAGNKFVRVDYMGNTETADHVPVMMQVRADGSPVSGGTQSEPVVSVPTPGDTYGYSTVKVPWLLKAVPLLANLSVFSKYKKVKVVLAEPAQSRSGNRSASSPIANIRRARCYFLAKDGDVEVHNWWRINDLVRCQTENINAAARDTHIDGETSKQGNVMWWRKAVGVSFTPVTLDDGKEYHYVDVVFDYDMEKNTPAAMATSVYEGSDIPVAGDDAVQFGNTIIEGRMNLMLMEVNGSSSVGYEPTTDAPCLKAYRGIYSFDLNKCWVGGKCCKMKLSPKTGYEFYGPNFRQVTEYDVVPVPVDRGLWTNICRKKNSSGEYIDEWQFEKDDYGRTVEYSDDDVTGRTTGVRKCYYYDKVSHGGQYWLCSIVDGAHWVNANGDYISDAAYDALTDEQKALCSRHPNYTIQEPSANSTDWTLVVEKGEKGDTGDSALIIDIDNDNDQFGVDADGKVLVQQTRSTVVSMLYGTTEQAFTSAPTATMKYDDGTSVASSVAEVAVAVVQNTDNKEYRVTVTIKATGANTPVFTASGKNGLYVDIEGTCAKGTKSIRFSLEKVMSGESGVSPIIYQLAPTQKGFSFGRDSSNNLTPSSRSSQINVAKTEGNTTTILSTAQTGITYKWGWDESTTAQATGQAIGTSISVSNTDAASHNQVWVELSTGDRETLPITKDGPKGDQGDDGADAIYANIAPANVLVATSENGVVGTEQTSEHLVEFFKGSAKQQNEFSAITCSIDGTTLDSEYHDENTPRKYYKVALTRSSGQLTGGLTLSVNSGFTLSSEVMQIVAVMTIGGESVSRTLELPIKALKQGEAGDDAIVLKADPENVIITQSTEQQGGSYPFIVVDTWSSTDILGFTQLKIVDGGTEKTTGFTVGTPVPSKIPGTQTNSCTCTVSGTKVGITAIGSASGAYATSGYVTIPVTYGGKSYQVLWNFYCNLLGTWKRSVENGTETSIGEHLGYAIDPSGGIDTIAECGTFIRGWAENTATLEKTVAAVNLLPSSCYTNAAGAVLSTGFDEEGQAVSADMYSPLIMLEPGMYCVSAYCAASPAMSYLYKTSRPTSPSDTGLSTSSLSFSELSTDTYDGKSRWYAYFNVSQRTYIYLRMTGTTNTIYRAMIERVAAAGAMPTPWEIGAKYYTSQIKQTAEAVNVEVSGKIPSINLMSLLNWKTGNSGTTALSNGDVKTGLIGYGNPLFSPMMYLDAGTYTFSAYMDNAQVYVEERASETAIASLQEITMTSSSETYKSKTRRYGSFTLANAAYVRIKTTVNAQTNTYIYRPQLEIGSSMRSYVPSVDANGTTGYIDVKANEVNLGIRNGLLNTGINITSGEVSVHGGDFTMQDENGNDTFVLDPDGNLQSQGDASFGGTIKANNFYHRVALASGASLNIGHESVVINDAGVGQRWMGFINTVTESGYTFEAGKYYNSGNYPSSVISALISNHPYDWRWCTAYADEIIIVDDSSTSGSVNPVVVIPRCQDVPGKMLVIRHTSSHISSDATIQQIDRGLVTYTTNPFSDGVYVSGGEVHLSTNPTPYVPLRSGYDMYLQSIGTAWIVLSRK